MDPNETLKRLREATKVFHAAEANTYAVVYGASEIPALHQCVGAGAEVVELAEALDEWLSHGGFLPGPWAR